MSHRAFSYLTGILLAGVLSLTGASTQAQAPSDPESLKQGERIFRQSCRWCHGSEGKGDGPAAFYIGAYTAPRPRNLTGEEAYKFRSTPSGEVPTDEDLFRTITKGIPGYMPAFTGLSPVERWQVVGYLRFLNPDLFDSPDLLDVPIPDIPPTPESIRRGERVYRHFECDACHGVDGRGDSDLFRAGELRDDRGLKIPPTDLTSPKSFKNGHSSREIAMSILTGFDGTPMPAFSDMFREAPEDLSHLVNYVLSLSYAAD